MLTLRREQADAWGHDGQRYDALLEGYEPGMRTKRLLPVLEQLKAHLVPMVDPSVGPKEPRGNIAPRPRSFFLVSTEITGCPSWSDALN